MSFDDFMKNITKITKITDEVFIVKSTYEIIIKLDASQREADIQNKFYSLTSEMGLCPKILHASSYTLPLNIGEYKKGETVFVIAMEYMRDFKPLSHIKSDYLIYTAMAIYTIIQFTLLMKMDHNDLHSNNIMVRDKAILIDFGMCMDLNPRGKYYNDFRVSYQKGNYEKCIEMLCYDIYLDSAIKRMMKKGRFDLTALAKAVFELRVIYAEEEKLRCKLRGYNCDKSFFPNWCIKRCNNYIRNLKHEHAFR